MTTKVISLKDYRSKITQLWKEARDTGVRYIVMYHSTPILEVRPYEGDELVFENSSVDNQKDYYETVEQGMGFWLDDKDDDIFEFNLC